MSNRRKFLTVSVNSDAKRQTNLTTGLANALHNKRIKVTVEVEDVIQQTEERDCGDVDLVDKTIDSQFKRATWTFAKVTPFWLAWFTAFFLSASGEPEETGEDTGIFEQPFTRSVSDDLAAFSFVDCFEDELSTAEKYIGHKVESITININRRQNVTMTVVTVGRFETAAVADFDLPDCENLPALKAHQCKILINNVDYTQLLWQMGITLNNNMPTGDDAFPFSGTDIQSLERGDQPAYSLSPQFVIKKSHALFTLAKNRSKDDIVVEFGDQPNNKFILTFPNTFFELNSNWRQFVGEINKQSVLIDATPFKDEALEAPLKADYFGSNDTQFLLPPA